MDIKEIALKIADSLRNKVDGISHMQSNQGLVAFAEALIAELAKQNEPVAWWNGKETAFFEHETDGPVGEVKIPLYTLPPTAEQIDNETAWQSIETAPKDGTDILCCGWLYNQPKNGWFHAVCWWNGYGFVDDGGDVDFVTHWMPLPTPPQRSMEGV